MTGPTHPVRGQDTVNGKPIQYRLLRSHIAFEDLPVTIKADTTEVKAFLAYKRYKTGDEWTEIEMKREGNPKMAEMIKKLSSLKYGKPKEIVEAEIAKRARGTPRVANRLLRRVRDFAEVKADGVITQDVASQGLDMLEVDDEGLDKMDRFIMCTIAEKFDGGPIGLSSLSAAVGEEKDTLEDVYEPFLIQKGYIKRTPQGRVVTRRAYLHLGLEKKGTESVIQKKLF